MGCGIYCKSCGFMVWWREFENGRRKAGGGAGRLGILAVLADYQPRRITRCAQTDALRLKRHSQNPPSLAKPAPHLPLPYGWLLEIWRGRGCMGDGVLDNNGFAALCFYCKLPQKAALYNSRSFTSVLACSYSG